MQKLVGIAVTTLFVCSLSAAAQPGRGKGPKVDFDKQSTPLQRSIEESVGNRKEKEKKQNPPCLRAIEADDADGIAKHCKFPGLGMDLLESRDVNSRGRKVGKKIKTRTTLTYAQPQQRDESKVRWDGLLLRPSDLAALSRGSSDKGTVLNSALFPGLAVNDDNDCIDRLTGEHLGGPSVPDGATGSCFDASGELVGTLTAEEEGCRHAGGPDGESLFLPGDPDDGEEDSCYDAAGNLKTTLEELIDEDGDDADRDGDGLADEDPEGDADGDGNPNDDYDCLDLAGNHLRSDDCFDAAGDLLADRGELVDEDGPEQIDDDGDGRTSEDPPEDFETLCRNAGSALGLTDTSDLINDAGECDLTRGLIVRANLETGGKLYQADAQGQPDPDAEGVEYGLEERQVTVTETFVAMCEGEMELDDDSGQCVGLESGGSPLRALDQAMATGSSDGTTTSLEDLVMMGFTFAPPRLEWGYEIEEKACVLGVCAEVFFAKVGYDFDVGLGLRLPAQVTVSEIPDSILAEEELTLATTIQPLDFSVEQYESFCQEHQLQRQSTISSCEKFAFPNWLDEILPADLVGEPDGDEFVARIKVFAGLVVRTFGVPLIQWGLDIDHDLAEMCSYLLMSDSVVDIAAQTALNGGDLKEALKTLGLNCGSFTTPFGEEPDPTNPGVNRLRTFPFAKSFDVRADCAEALARGEVVTIRGKTFIKCTGLVLGAHGASLGVGLGIEASMGSKRITADWSAAGDADPGDSGQVIYTHSADEGESSPSLGPVTVDNYAGGDFQDDAHVTLSDFTYFLNAFQLRLKAKIQFGGILSPIPDLPELTIYNFILDTGSFGIPVGQHAGTGDVTVPVLVENYALETNVSPAALEIKPGELGQFTVQVTNRGSFEGDFDDFAYELSNRRDQTMPFSFVIDPNTDHDCQDGAGTPLRGDPYDSVVDDCFNATGTLRADRTARIDEDDFGPDGALAADRDEDGDGLADEDPPDVWATLPTFDDFGGQTILDISPYASSTPPPSGTSLTLSISPFRHPLTAPGRYPFRVTADSVEAKAFDLAAQDPSGNARLGASGVAFIDVTAFREPQVAMQLAATSGKPGVGHTYTVEGTNMGNVDDSMMLGMTFADFNAAGCTLTTLGSLPECPFRAVPTVIQEDEWTTAGGLPAGFGPLAPLGIDTASFDIVVPRDWAGMEDTTYRFLARVTSLEDEESPPATHSVVAERTVVATLESMTRYIGLEIQELIDEIERANAQGIRTGGLLPIASHPVQSKNDRALALVLAGQLERAGRTHESNIHNVEAFVHALDGFNGKGKKIPPELDADWHARAAAILEDLAVAAASRISSAP